MKKDLLAAASKILICSYLGMISAVAVAQGTGAIVESRPLIPGQATSRAAPISSSSTSSNAASSSASNSDAMSLLLQQIQQLQTEVQALRGFIEEQGFELRNLQRDSLSRYTNMDDRLSALETGAAAIATSPAAAAGVANNPLANNPLVNNPLANNRTPINNGGALTPSTAPASGQFGAPLATTTPANNSVREPTSRPTSPASTARNGSRGTLEPVVLSEQQLYQMAYDSVINSNFERSVAEFDQYLGIYPQGRFVTNAHYWKGQAYLYLNRYDEAREAYEIIVNNYSDSPKLPDAMYGLGLAYQGLGNIQQARGLLTEIKRRFPNTGVANLADTRLLSLD